MENPFEKKPLMLIISLGAIIILILGAGIISTFYGSQEVPAPLSLTLPDSSYSISWEDSAHIISSSHSQPPITARTKLSLLHVQRIPLTFTEGISERSGLTLTFGALVSTLSSSTEKICDWKIPIGLRRVADEAGTLVAPQSAYFTPEQNTKLCIEPQKPLLLEKKVIFPIPESESEFLFTTGEPTNVFFTVKVSATGTIQVERAPQEIPG